MRYALSAHSMHGITTVNIQHHCRCHHLHTTGQLTAKHKIQKTIQCHLLSYPHRILSVLYVSNICLQCFDAVGWATGRVSTIQPVKNLSGGGTGVVIRIERDADLHMAQLMPLPLTVSCFSKIQIGFTFLIPAHSGSPGKTGVCVYMYRINSSLSVNKFFY